MTAEETKEYAKIKKQTAKEVFAPEFIPNKSGNEWMLDIGDYAVHIYLAPCDLGGVFLHLYLSFFWRMRKDYFDWAGAESDRVLSPRVPHFAEALLYRNDWVYGGPDKIPIPADTVIYSSPEDFRKYLKILLETGREKGLALDFRGDYGKLQQWVLETRGSVHNRCFDPDGKTVDAAIVSILAGDGKTGRALLQETVEKQTAYYSPLAQTLLEKCADETAFKDWIRQSVLAGRKIRRNHFPKMKAENIPAMESRVLSDFSNLT